MPGFTKDQRLPYIGITDFMRPQQVEDMQAVFDFKNPPDSLYGMHVGVMMTRKTLNGLQTKMTNAVPANQDIAPIMKQGATNSNTMRCLHYADYDNQGIDNTSHLIKALAFGGEHMNALQLDMHWPDPLQIARALLAFGRKIQVILQIGKGCFEECRDKPSALVARLRHYDGIIDRVLLDKSMGTGHPMNAEALKPFIRVLTKELPDLSITVAGGLGPGTMHLMEPLVEEFPGLSIDAQGRLRQSGSYLDPIDWLLAEEYLVKALEIMNA